MAPSRRQPGRSVSQVPGPGGQQEGRRRSVGVGRSAPNVYQRMESGNSSVQPEHQIGGEDHGQMPAGRAEASRGGMTSAPFLCGAVRTRAWRAGHPGSRTSSIEDDNSPYPLVGEDGTAGNGGVVAGPPTPKRLGLSSDDGQQKRSAALVTAISSQPRYHSEPHSPQEHSVLS
jgi:hypothetical protein